MCIRDRHWAAASGAITSFMDRIFYAANCSGKKIFYLKPAAAIVSARRAGATAAFDQLNKYFTLMQMPIIASQYWNMVPVSYTHLYLSLFHILSFLFK